MVIETKKKLSRKSTPEIFWSFFLLGCQIRRQAKEKASFSELANTLLPDRGLFKDDVRGKYLRC